MTEKQKMVESWVHALNDKHVEMDKEIEFDLVEGLATLPRVIYLTSLGYKIANWEQYVQAEINEITLK